MDYEKYELAIKKRDERRIPQFLVNGRTEHCFLMPLKN